MTKAAHLTIYSTLAVVAIGAVWLLFVLLPRPYEPGAVTTPLQPAAADGATRKITARLFFVAEDGLHLTAVERDVVYGEGAAAQAARIIEAQLGPPPEPHRSAIPAGTTLRSVFVSSQGEAYVDLSAEVGSAHPGGSLNELFTVYTIVNALTANLPAITGVQILVDGKEVDTLAGHVDLRRPLQENVRWVANMQAETETTPGEITPNETTR